MENFPFAITIIGVSLSIHCDNPTSQPNLHSIGCVFSTLCGSGVQKEKTKLKQEDASSELGKGVEERVRVKNNF